MFVLDTAGLQELIDKDRLLPHLTCRPPSTLSTELIDGVEGGRQAPTDENGDASLVDSLGDIEQDSQYGRPGYTDRQNVQ